MMKAFATLSCTLVLLGSQIAWAEDSPKSIMFESDKDYSHLTTRPAQQSGQSQDNKCAELLQQMEALKGKPQRRYAVSQQYEAECQR